MSHFHTFAKKIHVPFSKISSIRADFRIHIMSLTADDSLFEVAEFFGLAGLGSASVIRTLIKANAHEVFYSKEVARLLVIDEASLKTYSAKKGFPLVDTQRLMRWSRWSKSAEKTSIRRHFKTISEKV
jgi:hypothetical protein